MMKHKKAGRLLQLRDVDVEVVAPPIINEKPKIPLEEKKIVKPSVKGTGMPEFRKRNDIHVNANNIRLVL